MSKSEHTASRLTKFNELSSYIAKADPWLPWDGSLGVTTVQSATSSFVPVSRVAILTVDIWVNRP